MTNFMTECEWHSLTVIHLCCQIIIYGTNDTDKFIEWWVYEDQMKGELTVMDNDVEYTFHNAAELYDYLVKNNKQNNAS